VEKRRFTGGGVRARKALGRDRRLGQAATTVVEQRMLGAAGRHLN
jgi:hypothetical protein